MADYSKGKIYCIRNPECDEVYIGSTTETLDRRLQKHKADYKLWKKGTRGYTTSFKLFEVGTPTIELLEDYPCNNRTELEKREGEIIRITENCVNKYIAGRTDKEYNDASREYRKEYYEVNKERINQKKREYMKEYYEANRERKREYNREYLAKQKALTCQSDDTLHSSQQNDPSIMLNASS